MTIITILRAADRRPQPWKNLGGVTREVIAYPPAAGMDDFQWRLSIADVEHAGPFSHFAGIDRILAVLEGVLVLDIGSGHAPVTLTPKSSPLAFPGDMPVTGEPVGGPVRDLNLMVRRNVAHVQVRRLEGQKEVVTDKGTTLLVATDALTVTLAGRSIALAPLDALTLEGPTAVALHGSCYLYGITPIADQ